MHKSMARGQKGFSLLEALIAFLILATGMLGIVSLQAISMKAGQASIYNTAAVIKVQELFESMHINPGALASYTGAGSFNNCSTAASNCTEAQHAQEDVFLWRQGLQETMPLVVLANTTVNITPAVAPSRLATATVTVEWQERDKDGGGAITKTYSSTANICTQVPC